MTEALVHQTPSLIQTMSDRYGLAAGKFMDTVKATVFPADKQVSNEQAAAFLVVANQYELNPFTKEIYAFPGKNGGIVPVVSVDGWASLINRQPLLDGIEFDDHREGEELIAVTCRIYRKDRTKPTEVTEYMRECKRNTDPWKQWPRRMLRHKALIQCARYAFGLSGVVDQDDAERPFDSAQIPPSREIAQQRSTSQPEILSPSMNEPALTDEAHALMTQLVMNKAKRDAEIGKNKDRLPAFVEELKQRLAARNQKLKDREPVQAKDDGKQPPRQHKKANPEPTPEEDEGIYQDDAETFTQGSKPQDQSGFGF